jgi:hypothetical protein
VNFKKIKKIIEKEFRILIIIFSIIILFFSIIFFQNNFSFEGGAPNNLAKIFQKNKEENFNFRKNIFLEKSENLKNSGCISLKISEEKKCNLRTEKISQCLENIFFLSPSAMFNF